MGEIYVSALENVSIKVKRREFCGLLGSSGCGKTTLINIIGGLDKPSTGKVIVDGIDLSTLGDKQLSVYRRKKVGIVFQFFNLISTLTALENIILPLQLHGRVNNAELYAIKILDTVGLGNRIYHRPSELSGGEQQRVAIARALVNDPEVLLLDEPTGNLDLQNTIQLMKLLKEINASGKTVLIATHDDYVASYCDRLVKMNNGKWKTQLD